ncbi:MAG TPA: hypothetical protein VGB08_08330 [Allosphingosinicella sp.]
MAEKQTGPVRFDDFVNAVHADPAEVQPRVLLSGFVGRSATEGNIRVYSDPSLSHWVEAPAAAVVHSAPIADSPLGGSHVWVDASTELTPGSAGVSAAAEGGDGGEGGGGAAGLAGQAVGGIGADTGVFNPMGGAAITLHTHPAWCPTLGITCTYVACPRPTLQTQYLPCGPRPTMEFICPPTRMLGCPRTSTCPPTQLLGCGTHICAVGGYEQGGMPPTLGMQCPASNPCLATFHMVCQPTYYCHARGGDGGGPEAAAATNFPGCGNSLTCTPQTHMLGCPGSSTCTPQTHLMGCPGSSTCTPPTQMLGCPGSSTCTPQGGGNTTATVCMQFGPQGLAGVPITHKSICIEPVAVNTQVTVCPQTSICMQGQAQHAWGNTTATVCTQIGCTPQTHMLGCPPTSTCPPHTSAIGCPGTSTCMQGQAQGGAVTWPPMCPMTGPNFCPPSVGCPG